MSFKKEDFPTPVSPTRRRVYGPFAPSFDVLMIPLLMESTLLANSVRTITLSRQLTYLRARVSPSSSSSKAFSHGPSDASDVQLEGNSLLDRPPKLVAIRGSEFRGRTYGSGLTRETANIVRMMTQVTWRMSGWHAHDILRTGTCGPVALARIWATWIQLTLTLASSVRITHCCGVTPLLGDRVALSIAEASGHKRVVRRGEATNNVQIKSALILRVLALDN